MFKRIVMATALCLVLSSCDSGEFRDKYREELISQLDNELIKQGICHEFKITHDGKIFSGNNCDGEVLIFGGQRPNLFLTFYIPKKNFDTFDYLPILDMVNKVYIRDKINIDVTFYNGGILGFETQKDSTKRTSRGGIFGLPKEEGTKKAFRVRYETY